MAPKKKGKGSKLSRMTEEERSRYLQHRAAVEEEARRRKQQLVANFMKNKLKHEEAFTRLNLAKINQQWRQILRQIKTKELKQDMENLWHFFEHVIETKSHVIESLLKELDESEEQYARNFQSHAETIDQLVALHARQLEELRDSYLRDQNALLLEASREEQEIKSRAKYNEEHLKTINFQMLHDMETWNSVWKENHTLKTDEIRNNMLSIIDEVQCYSESTLEKLWKEFQATLQQYISSTEDNRNQYVRLKAQDEASSKTILKHCKIITSYSELITSLKQQLSNLKLLHEQQTHDLKAEHSYYYQYFFSLRNQLVHSRKLDEKQLSCLITSSNEAIKELESLLEKGEHILQLASVCRRMETEREKVLPFVTAPHISAILSQVEQDDLETAYKEEPKEPLAKEIFNYMKLDNFWKRYNRAYLECAALSLHRDALILENQQLMRTLKQYLASMAQGKEHPLQLQPSLTVARPVSSHIIREHINLMPSASGEEEKAKRQPKVRPITCIEASTSIAVRHMLRSGAL